MDKKASKRLKSKRQRLTEELTAELTLFGLLTGMALGYSLAQTETGTTRPKSHSHKGNKRLRLVPPRSKKV